MKVCLVSSPTVSEFDPRVAESKAVRSISERAPIGILTLAAILEERAITVEIVDLNRLYYRYIRSRKRGDFCSFVAREFASRSCDVYGFSTICSAYPLTLRIAREVKRSHPHALIMLGGPQASAVDTATLRSFPFIDLIVRGEADETLPLLLDAVADARGFAAIPGVTFRSGGKIVHNPDAPVILDLDRLPMPAFHLYPGLETCQTVPLEAGRGCPFSCKFCSTNGFFGHRFRLKSPGRVIEQMRFIRQNYGNTRFNLIHDMFTADRQRVVGFCEALLACGEPFQWVCSARTDCIDDELIALMARAGCTGVFFGIETGSARLQKAISKNLNLSQAAARIRTSVRHHINTTVSLITGFPDEERRDLWSTIAFLMDAARFEGAKPQLHILAPLAATPIYEQYRDRLAQTDVLSDESFHGWRQDPADRELIRSYPEIFPNFYALPGLLDRQYIGELRDFIQHALLRCRWLLVALHQDSGGLIEVFEAWRKWLGENRPAVMDSGHGAAPYYARSEFARDLLEFVRSHYLPRARNRQALCALLDFEWALREKQTGGGPPKKRGAPRLAPGVRIIRLDGDYLRILACLRMRKPDAAPARRVVLATRDTGDEKVQVLELSPLSAQILTLSDGTRTTTQIARRLDPGCDLAGIPRYKICLFGLTKLREAGLIDGSASIRRCTSP